MFIPSAGLDLICWALALVRGVSFSPTVKSLANVVGVASLENRVEYSAAGTESSGHTLRRVMIEVMLLHVTEIRIAKIGEVGGVVNPLFGYIRLESRSHHNRSSEGWKKQHTQRHHETEKRQQIAYPAAHMFAVKRLFMMTKMCGVEILVRDLRPESLVAPLRYFPMPVQDIAMRKVFQGHPGHDADGDKHDSPKKVA